MSSETSNGSQRPVIESLHPPAAISGGDLEIRGTGLGSRDSGQPVVRFGDTAGRLVVGGSKRVVVQVPEEAIDGLMTLESSGVRSAPHPCAIGLSIAQNLHPVTNPAVDADGVIYTTRSGARGEKVPVSVFKIDLNFNIRPLVSDIVNPTGLLIDNDGRLLISGRNNGTIYQVDDAGSIEIYAEGMGIATIYQVDDAGSIEIYAEGMGIASGMAIDHDGNLFVGDRTGTIFKISRDRQIFVFATLEPSISAYHLAMSPDQNLLVTGPTTSSFDNIYRIDANGVVDVFFRGLGRPQGMAFDVSGDLFVTASYRGRKGVFRITPEGNPTQVLSGPGIVGLAFLPSRELVVATTDSLFRVSTTRLDRRLGPRDFGRVDNRLPAQAARKRSFCRQPALGPTTPDQPDPSRNVVRQNPPQKLRSRLRSPRTRNLRTPNRSFTRHSDPGCGAATVRERLPESAATAGLSGNRLLTRAAPGHSSVSTHVPLRAVR